MKKTIFYLFLLLPLPALAHDYHSSYEQNNKCYGNVYREKYIQGNIKKPGYVRKWEETIRIPCANHKIEINKMGTKVFTFKLLLILNSFISFLVQSDADQDSSSL